jgi:superoxide dismutase, Cu-Zn family
MRFLSSAICGLLITGFLLGAARLAGAASAEATINAISTSGVGARLGTVTLIDTARGLLITPKLSGLPPGEHGFHIHDMGNCGPGINEGKSAAGFAAGGHYDPSHTKKHLGPFSSAGHRGDLPVLVVDSQGKAAQPVTAPHLNVGEVRGRSIMIHAGGDNYSDTPKPLGGGGARIACGIVQ